MIIDGKAIAEDVLRSLAQQRAASSRGLTLGVVMSGGDAVSDSFVRIKERSAAQLNVRIVREELPATATTPDAIAAVQKLAASCDGIIVQLPLAAGIDAEAVLAAVSKEKDVDAINPTLTDNERPVRAPVAEAVAEILERSGVAVAGKKAVVIGAGRLVGKPAAHLLKSMGANVSIITETHGSLEELKDADIVVSGAGEPAIITPDIIKDGVVLIDAGTSEASGKIAGDADPACADKCAVFTPVPGGVGPIAVAMIFKNLFALVQK